MKRWEYKVVEFPMPADFGLNQDHTYEWIYLQETHQKMLNELGYSRWEYCDRIGPMFYFKRKIEQ